MGCQNCGKRKESKVKVTLIFKEKQGRKSNLPSSRLNI